MSSTKPVVSDLLRRLPGTPGVYRFYDAAGAIIYIGKAKSLKNRVKSYFRSSQKTARRSLGEGGQKTADHSPKTLALVKEIADLKWIETNSEVEALVLESNLVKEHQPKYNVLLRDDKHFLYFKLTTNAEYPRVELVRRVEKDGARYFGPKIDSDAARETVRFLERLFHARVCGARPETDHALTSERRKTLELPCPFFKMAMCPGPALETPEAQSAYDDYIRQVTSFLAGNAKEVLAELTTTMQAAALAKNFEYAARLRDQLVAIQKTTEKQVVSDPSLASRDVLGVVIEHTKAYLALLEVRDGRLIDQKNFTLRVADDDLPTAIEGFLTQYYQLTTDLPREILLPEELPNAAVVGEWLAGLAGRKVELLVPERGQKSGLLKLAEKNAAAYATQSKAKFENASERTVGAAKELAVALGIEKELKRIECYDISHLGGTATTASMVVFANGEPQTADYRHFKIRSLADGEIDDYASLAEILRRRMANLTPQLSEGVKIRRATKKDVVAVQKILAEEEGATIEIEILAVTPLFVALDSAGAIIAHARECVFGERIHALKNVWVAPVWRGHHLGLAVIRKLIDASDALKIYLDCEASLAEYYAELGFQHVYDIPPELTPNIPAGNVCLLYARRSHKPDESFATTPDLVILDGGKGQLSAVLSSVQFPKKTTVVALAKQFEEIFKRQKVEGKRQKESAFECVRLPENSNALHLVTRLRDEAHRFANELRKKVLAKTEFTSSLDELTGVGESTRTKLLKKFGSAASVSEASESELIELLGEVDGRGVYKQIHE